MPMFFKLRLITYSHRIPINYLLDNLAVADIIYPIFSIPKTILRHTFTPPPPRRGEWKSFMHIAHSRKIAWLGAGSSLFTLVAIAMERYYAVIYPLGNKGKLGLRKLKMCHWAKTMNDKLLFKESNLSSMNL